MFNYIHFTRIEREKMKNSTRWAYGVIILIVIYVIFQIISGFLYEKMSFRAGQDVIRTENPIGFTVLRFAYIGFLLLIILGHWIYFYKPKKSSIIRKELKEKK